MAAATTLAALLESPANPGLLGDAAVVTWRLGDGDEALRLLAQATVADRLRAFTPLMAMGFIRTSVLCICVRIVCTECLVSR